MLDHAPIFFLTDFGLSDPFVGVMKAVILSLGHRGPLIDLTHGIAPQDVAAGAVALEDALPWLPTGSVVCAVVDPGVGTPRRAIALRVRRRLFVAPDNGLLTPVLADEKANVQAVAIECGEGIVPTRSATFHGRDVFAPAAGALAMEERSLAGLGPTITDLMKLEMPGPQPSGEGEWELPVLCADHFGNLATSLRVDHPDLQRDLLERSQFYVEGVPIGGLRRTFGDVRADQPVAYFNSAGRLEIAVRNGSAARRFGPRPKVELKTPAAR